MAEMSNYLENALVNVTLRATSYTAPTTVYLALYSNDPTDADTGTEISGTNYARQSITFGAPSNGAMVIDQRNAGASVSNLAGALTYSVDRWP